MAISLQIYNLLSNLPKNYQKKDDDEHEYDLTQKFFIISHRNHGNHRKGFAQPCGMLLKRTQISQITQICFPFFRLLSVSSVINIYLRNLRDLHDLKPTHIFVSIGACRLRRSCRFSSHTEVFNNFPQNRRTSENRVILV